MPLIYYIHHISYGADRPRRHILYGFEMIRRVTYILNSGLGILIAIKTQKCMQILIYYYIYNAAPKND